MLDRNKVLQAFRRAYERLREDSPGRKLRPRTVAVLAHAFYCADLKPMERRPAVETFRKFSTGQLPFPEVVAYLREAGVRRIVRSHLNRQRLRLVFEEAIQRLELRLLKGQARPLQVVRRAYDLYTRDAPGAAPPSLRTFEDLIYGKSADREILSLIEAAFTRPRKAEEQP